MMKGRYFDEQVIDFLFNLQMGITLPKGIGILDVHNNNEVQKACSSFYRKFYHDKKERRMLVGINPGRFGGGVTGLPFTDPIRLEQDCGIKNSWQKKQELSSVFMYEMMKTYWSVKKFYSDFYITAISPLGFVKDGKNLNYYDDKNLKKDIVPFVIECMNKQLSFGIQTDVAFCIGEGENLKFFQQLNDQHKWFKRIEGLPHPRFIMQYKLKQKTDYTNLYIKRLNNENVIS
ncbi:MAG: hypothetical protein JWN76_1699 [Chitinophagaceae bacterium]|nr:hypothetical protein [Chitinophagaceae bacterium]